MRTLQQILAEENHAVAGTDRAAGAHRAGHANPAGNADESTNDIEDIDTAVTERIPRIPRYRAWIPFGTTRLARVLIVAQRTVATLLSLAVLLGTGYGWSNLNHLESNLNTTDVITPPPPDAPSDGATDILLVGSDSRTDANGNPLPLEVLKLLRTEESAGLNTDTIILVRVPNDGGQAYAVSVPRDTYVPIPDYRDDKINAAYGAGTRLARDRLRGAGVTDQRRIDRESTVAGQRALVQVMEELTGVKIDHYAEINLYGFYLLTEAIGGVEVCLRRPTKDPDSGANFRQGRQRISGGDALSFVRQRKNLPRGDLDRIVRQQVFMAALANRMLAAGTLADPGKLSGLVDAVQKSIVLDDGWDVLGFANQLRGIAAGDVEFVTIPVVEVDARNERGQSIITIDPAAVRAFVTGLTGPKPPATPPSFGASSSPGAGPPAAPPDISSVVVSVLNGTNRGGLANRVTAVLARSGYRTGQPDSTQRHDRTEIQVPTGARAVGEQIATAIGGGLPVIEDPQLPAGRAKIILGADYTGPEGQPMAAAPPLRLDGTANTPLPRHQPSAPPPNDDAPITAEGIPCVN